MSIWPFRRPAEKNKAGSSPPQHARELRIATNGSYSIRASIENLRVDGAGSYSQSSRVRAALFVPTTSTTIQFHAEANKKPGSSARASCVHALQMFTPEETARILDDAKRIGSSIGWSDRGVSLPTQDVLVQNLSKESQECVHRAIREKLLPFARRQYAHLNVAFDKQPYPRPGNLFIVRYSAASQRPGGRGLKLHKDETALTFNLCLSAEDDFTGGGTYFPAASSDVDGILLRPLAGYSLIHDGNIKHAGNEVRTGERFILVGFYNADGRDRAGEEQYFSKKAREEARLRNPIPPQVQTIYFTTAVAACRAGTGTDGMPHSCTGSELPLPPVGVAPLADAALAEQEPEELRTGMSAVAIQGPEREIKPLVAPSRGGSPSGSPTGSPSGSSLAASKAASSKDAYPLTFREDTPRPAPQAPPRDEHKVPAASAAASSDACAGCSSAAESAGLPSAALPSAALPSAALPSAEERSGEQQRGWGQSRDQTPASARGGAKGRKQAQEGGGGGSGAPRWGGNASALRSMTKHNFLSAWRLGCSS